MRLRERLPAVVAAGEPVAVEVWVTNENGSVLKLREPVEVALRMVAPGAPATPLPAATVSIAVAADGGGGGGGGGKGKGGGGSGGGGSCRVTIPVEGIGRFKIVFTGGSVACRLAAQPVKPDAAVAAWGGGEAGASGRPSARPPVADDRVPIAHLVTSVVRVVPRGSHTGAAAAASTGSDDDSGDGGATQLFTLPLPLPLCFVEAPMKVLPGFGSIVWDAALAMAGCLAAGGKAALAGRVCIDIGTGTGCVGLTAVAAGAHVLLTDVEAMLPQVHANVRLNAAAVAAGGGSATVTALPWGDAEGIEAACKTASALVSKPPPTTAAAAAARATPFDIILASEVAYRAEVFPLLVDTLAALAGAPPAAASPPAAAPTPPSYDDIIDSLPLAPRDGVDPPYVLLGARRRACCEIEDFLVQLQARFTVYRMGTAEAGGDGSGSGGGGRGGSSGGRGGGGGRVGVGSQRLSGCLPPPVASLMARAATLSKTAYVPALYMLVPRAA